MYDMRVPIVGTALTAPEKRVLEKSGTVVTTFRVVMNYRRVDRVTQQWVDYGLFRVKVNCWRRLGEHVYSSIRVGDPVIVIGRIFTREWQGEQGELRLYYEIDADTVGHDLSRGVTDFTKTLVAAPQSVVEDDEADARIGGELSYPVGSQGLVLPHDPEDGSEIAPEAEIDAMAAMREAELADPSGEEPVGGGDDDEELVGASAGARRRRGR
jgi:single-strand DNA-binding protein